MTIDISDMATILSVQGETIIEVELPDCGDYLTMGCSGYITWSFMSVSFRLGDGDYFHELLHVGNTIQFEHTLSDGENDHKCTCWADILAIKIITDAKGRFIWECTVSGEAYTELLGEQSDKGWAKAMGVDIY